MRRNWRNNRIPVSIFFALLIILGGCGRSGEKAEHAETYTCPMHPTVVSDRPGSCPVCGMDLVRRARAGEEVQITGDLARLIKSPNETVVASIKTIRGEFRSMPVTIQAQGVVTYDTRNIYTISARIGGRLEKVYLKYAFEKIRKGQKVADIYSPVMLNAQRELLYLLEHDALNEDLIRSAKQRLSLLGASPSQIEVLIRRKEIQSIFSVYSPFDGYVIADDRLVPPAPAASTSATSADGSGMDAMTSSGNTSANSSEVVPDVSEGSFIREGIYVSTGQTLFRVVNTSALRVELNVPSSGGARIKRGDPVQLNFGNEKEQQATVDFIQPYFNEGEEFIKVRVYTKGTENLHIGHLVDAKISLGSAEGLWIPHEAVLDLGLEKIVFIKDHNVLKPKKITTGAVAGEWIEVRQGLSSSEEIASNAQYLVDSESFIKTQK